MGRITTYEGDAETGYVGDLVPEIAAELSEGALVDRQHVEDEIDLMLRTIRQFWQMEPDVIMRMTSAMSARCTELAVHLHRLEGNRAWKQLRTMQVDRVLLELDRQWKGASRMLEIRRQDIALSR
jgi:hypothetical protein